MKNRGADALQLLNTTDLLFFVFVLSVRLSILKVMSVRYRRSLPSSFDFSKHFMKAVLGQI